MIRLLAFLLLASSACAQPAKDSVSDPRERRADSVVTRASVPDAEAPGDSAVVVRSVGVRIGETPVEIRTTERACARTCWSALNVHDDENTATQAATAVIARRGGRLVELRHAGTRTLTFRLGGEAFTVDPNRIFTPAGRARTLASLSRDTPAARAAVAAFADTLLAVYSLPWTRSGGTPSVVVTLHNNTENGYSSASYQTGGSEANEAEAVRLAPGADTDDFVFVTTRPLFDAVAASGVNAVLQNNETPTDDGSLSVWAAQNGLPYLNVEAQHGHLDQNTRMIELIPAWTGEKQTVGGEP